MLKVLKDKKQLHMEEMASR